MQTTTCTPENGTDPESNTAPTRRERDLTAFQQNILTVLAEDPRYGLAVKRELEDYYGEEVNHGRLYPNLDTLVNKDLVEKSELDKRTNEYALTQHGFDVVVDHLEWQLGKFLTSEGRQDLLEDHPEFTGGGR